MKDLWHPHLIDIPNIIFPIIVLCIDNQVDLGIFVNDFFPFHLVDASLTFLRFCFCCVDSKASACPLEEHGVFFLVWSYKKTYKHNNNYGVKISMDIFQIMKLP
jgi:hypothetical protein